jgi:hypothetical protein
MGAVGASALVSAILFWPATHVMFPNGIVVGTGDNLLGTCAPTLGAPGPRTALANTLDRL